MCVCDGASLTGKHSSAVVLRVVRAEPEAIAVLLAHVVGILKQKKKEKRHKLTDQSLSLSLV